ncbi:hypothetical protein PuT2_11505 [Pusillimonas sp. T2]|uniref:hypothetical protein n=1 Tax=Pusillimonas sp. T2 TaxID=1548123 RepID=UPI000B9D07D6|nr:hypothetical protein [Pusillimonas sp. T2]OXR48593.1 hypothetical protein PuT2_11505 [Pusillimonas sp. T2]
MSNVDTTISIDRMLADMDKGFKVMRRHIKPEIITSSRQTLANENGDTIFSLFNDLSGPTISLAAGTLAYAGDAVNAFIHAQANLFVLNRDVDAPGKPLEHVLDHHEKELLNWVKYGVISAHPTCDLSIIGQDVLTTEQERIGCPATAVSLSIVRTLRHFLRSSITSATHH